MKTAYKVLTLLALAAAFTACKKGETRGETISIYTDQIATRAGETVDANLLPTFLFWTAGNFGDVTKTAPDFFTRDPEGMIDDYKTEKYNTQVYYPLYDEVVYAAGVAPAIGGDYIKFETANDYSKLVIPQTPNPVSYGDDVRGVTDPLAAATISGKDSAPLGTLLFKHATTKIAFEAMLTETMTKYITNVQVKIPGSLTAVGLNWNATDGVYEVVGGTDATDTVAGDDYWMGNYWTDDGTYLADSYRANETKTRLVSAIARERVGYTLIVPPGNQMTVTVQYLQADTADGTYTLRTIDNVVIKFEDASHNPITLKAGDAYTVRFYFDNYDIELVGQKLPWEDGGFISLPFQIR